MPRIGRDFDGDGEPALVWRNDLDGLVFTIRDRYLEWKPGFGCS